MSAETLNALLTRLHEELAKATTIDAESRRLVDVEMSDFQKLGKASAAPGGFEELAVHFEAEHPALAAALRQVADVLGKAGI